MKKLFFALAIVTLSVACAEPVFGNVENNAEIATATVGNVFFSPKPWFRTVGEYSFQTVQVQKGDNLCDLAEKYYDGNEQNFYLLINDNPWFADERRIRFKADGITISELLPGQEINVRFPVEQAIDSPKPAKKESVPVIAPEPLRTYWLDSLPVWAWILILFAAALLFRYLWNKSVDRRAKRKAALAADPVTQGPPMYKNGLNDTNVRSHFENRLAQEGAYLTVRNIRKGKLYSDDAEIPTEYADHDRPAIYNGQVGYEAEVELPSGMIELRHTLLGCGNDLRRGANIPNVRFVPDAEQPAALSPQPATTGQPTAAATPQSEQKIQEKIEEKENKASAGEVLQTVILELQHVSAEEIKITVGSVTFEARNLNRNTTSIVEEKTSDA